MACLIFSLLLSGPTPIEEPLKNLEPFALPGIQIVFGQQKKAKNSWTQESSFFDEFFKQEEMFEKWMELSTLRPSKELELY